MKKTLKLQNKTFERSLNGMSQAIMMAVVCGGIPMGFIISKPDILIDIFSNISTIICFIALVGSIVLAFVFSIYFLIKGNIDFNKNPKNVKSMIFDTNGINMIFNDSSLNHFYNYNDIRELKLLLDSSTVQDQRGNSHVLIKQLEIIVTDYNYVKRSIFVSKIMLFDTNMRRLLRKFVFFTQFITNFSYSFEGPTDYIADHILATRPRKKS